MTARRLAAVRILRKQSSTTGGYPLLVQLAPQLSACAFNVEFEDTLHNLLDRLGPGAAARR